VVAVVVVVVVSAARQWEGCSLRIVTPCGTCFIVAITKQRRDLLDVSAPGPMTFNDDVNFRSVDVLEAWTEDLP